MASFSLQALFLVGAALLSCRRIPSISKSSVSASASCVLAQFALQLSAQSVCLTPLRAQNSPVVDVDRDGWLRIGQERDGCLIEKKAMASKTCSQRDVHVSLLTKVQRPRAPHGQNCTQGRHPITALPSTSCTPEGFKDLELIEAVLDIIR